MLPLVVALLSQSVNFVVGQEVEQLFYLRISQLELDGLSDRPDWLMNDFHGDGGPLYISEKVFDDGILGMIEMGRTPSEDGDLKVERILQAEGIEDPSNGEMVAEKAEQTIETSKRYYALSKFRDPGNKNDPSRFILRFTNGHKFAWFPFNGLWFPWMAGSEEWRKSMDDMKEPVFVQKPDGTVQIAGASSWDNFVCRTPLIDEADADTESESQAGGPSTSIWWEFASLQRSVWEETKAPRVNEDPIDCIPVALSLTPATPQLNDVAQGVQEYTGNNDVIQQEPVVSIESYSSDESGPIVQAAAVTDNNGSPFLFNFDDDVDSEEYPQGGQSYYLSHPNTGTHRVIQEESSGSDEEYDQFLQSGQIGSPRQSEQPDSSQTEEMRSEGGRQLLELPDADTPPPQLQSLNRANSAIGFGGNRKASLQNGFPGLPRLENRFRSAGELIENGNGGLLKALASKSEEQFKTGAGPLKITTTKSDDVIRD
ncbi:hypothetical protein TWF281_008110 [Arthrobotrys megalospora]